MNFQKSSDSWGDFVGKGPGGVWEASVHNGYILYMWPDDVFCNLWRLEF